MKRLSVHSEWERGDMADLAPRSRRVGRAHARDSDHSLVWLSWVVLFCLASSACGAGAAQHPPRGGDRTDPPETSGEPPDACAPWREPFEDPLERYSPYFMVQQGGVVLRLDRRDESAFGATLDEIGVVHERAQPCAEVTLVFVPGATRSTLESIAPADALVDELEPMDEAAVREACATGRLADRFCDDVAVP